MTRYAFPFFILTFFALAFGQTMFDHVERAVHDAATQTGAKIATQR